MDSTALSGAIARMLAEDVSPGSGSTASAKTVPSDPTTTDQNSEPGRFNPTGQPARTRPSLPMAARAAPGGLVAGLKRQVQGAVRCDRRGRKCATRQLGPRADAVHEEGRRPIRPTRSHPQRRIRATIAGFGLAPHEDRAVLRDDRRNRVGDAALVGAVGRDDHARGERELARLRRELPTTVEDEDTAGLPNEVADGEDRSARLARTPAPMRCRRPSAANPCVRPNGQAQ